VHRFAETTGSRNGPIPLWPHEATIKLQRAAWRARYANRSDEQNVEIIDLIQEPERTPNPNNTEQTESSAAVYTATIT